MAPAGPAFDAALEKRSKKVSPLWRNTTPSALVTMISEAPHSSIPRGRYFGLRRAGEVCGLQRVELELVGQLRYLHLVGDVGIRHLARAQVCLAYRPLEIHPEKV